ncbi:MAG TPA: xylulokinase [Bryobacteraceae bacterium]|nr:xylulokinase [Bryobacteraceae bacterium]
MYWLGIDIGTGGSRALLVDERGNVKASFTAIHEDMRMERPLWAEQRPENWWDAAQQAVRGVLRESGAEATDIKGIGLSGQMHGLTLLDKDDEIVRPALIWCDQRSQAQVDFINSKVGREQVLAYTANPVVTGFTLPKLLWVRDNEPANFERIRKVLLPKDYVRFRLTGEYATEVSDASGTSLFDVVKRDWSYDMCDAVGLDRAILPECHESIEISGKLLPHIAENLGLQPGTPVVGGGGDQAASAVGNGIVQTGVVSCTLGTSGVVFAHMDQPHYDAQGRVHTFCHAVPGKWHVMGVTQGAGLSLQWLRNQLMPGEDYSVLTKEAATADAGSQGLYWLPYLMGERTPHLDATARAAWVGLTAKHKRADLLRSVIEGVCYSQKDGLDIIEEMGTQLHSVRLSGGGARSPFWKQTMADVLNKRITTLASQEGSAYGAALLAAVGTGAYKTVEECCSVAIREVEQVLPEPRNASQYAKLHKVFQSIYPALEPVFGRL